MQRFLKCRVLLALLTPFSDAALADENPTGEIVGFENTQDTTRLAVAPMYYRMTNNKGTVTAGVALDTNFTFALNDRFAMGPKFQQAYSQDNGVTALFNVIGFGGEYALTGVLKRKHQKTFLYGVKAFEHTSIGVQGFRVNLHLVQYLINSTKAAVPFSGLGFGLCYEWPFWAIFNFKAGMEMDRISSGEVSTVPLKYYFGVVSII